MLVTLAAHPSSTISVPNVIFLQAPEFSGYQVRLKNYENGHKNIFGLPVVLELKVENWALF